VNDALEKKLLTEADIERNIRGNIRMRMRLGEFDPPEMSPYNGISGAEEPWYGEKNKLLARRVTRSPSSCLGTANTYCRWTGVSSGRLR